jgi:hypothetical protein
LFCFGVFKGKEREEKKQVFLTSSYYSFFFFGFFLRPSLSLSSCFSCYNLLTSTREPVPVFTDRTAFYLHPWRKRTMALSRVFYSFHFLYF